MDFILHEGYKVKLWSGPLHETAIVRPVGKTASGKSLHCLITKPNGHQYHQYRRTVRILKDEKGLYIIVKDLFGNIKIRP